MTADAAILDDGLVELRSIEQVPLLERTDKRFWHLGATWFSMNWVIPTLAVGFLPTFFSLNFGSAVLAILIFNPLGSLSVAYFSKFGPQTGLRQMVVSRFAFGMFGAMIMALINMAICIGWSVVNVVIGGSAVSTGASIQFDVAIVILATATCAVSLIGRKAVHRYERYLIIPTTLLFGVLLWYAAPHLDVNNGFGSFSWAGFITMGGAVYGFATGWSSYAADYSVKMNPTLGAKKVFFYTLAGVSISCIVLESIAALMITSVSAWADQFGPNGVGGVLGAILQPLGTAGQVLLVLLGLTVVANNIPNDYSFSISAKAVGGIFDKISRPWLTVVGTVIYAGIALAIGPSIGPTFESFLLVVAYWLGPYAAIVLVEDLFRRNHYNDLDYQLEKWLPTSGPALKAFGVGMIGVLLGASQAIYVGPLAKLIEGSPDIGFELGMLLAAVTYLILRIRASREQPARYGRPDRSSYPPSPVVTTIPSVA